MALDSYYNNENACTRSACFFCFGKLIPTKEHSIINNILIQIYKCLDCGYETKILEKPSLQTSVDPSDEIPTISEKHDHPEA